MRQVGNRQPLCDGQALCGVAAACDVEAGGGNQGAGMGTEIVVQACGGPQSLASTHARGIQAESRDISQSPILNPQSTFPHCIQLHGQGAEIICRDRESNAEGLKKDSRCPITNHQYPITNGELFSESFSFCQCISTESLSLRLHRLLAGTLLRAANIW